MSLDALVGYTRSVGQRLWAEGIRVNAICPGIVQTPIYTSGDKFDSIFPEEVWIEMSVVTGIVSQLLSGDELVDGNNTRVGSDGMHSRALYISGKTFFFLEKPEFPDEKTSITWSAMMGQSGSNRV